jgi:uncharacterized phage-associated protein
MPGPYEAKGVANAFLQRGMALHTSIDPMKIQKLVYFAHGYYLALSERPLINELFEVWQHGPVLPSLYHEFKVFGYQPITQLAYSVNWDTDEFVPNLPPVADPTADKCLDYVWNTFAPMPSTELSRLTHAEDGPWARARKENTFNLRNKDIPNDYIKDYFKRFVKQ